MTAPTTRATPKIALDQRAASRHDTAAGNLQRHRVERDGLAIAMHDPIGHCHINRFYCLLLASEHEAD